MTAFDHQLAATASARATKQAFRENMRVSLTILLGAVLLFVELGNTMGQVIPPLACTAMLGMAVVQRHRLLPGLPKFLWIGSFPAFALMSTLWSATPSLTLYYATQLGLTAIYGYVLWATLDLRQFICTAYAAALLTCLVSVAVGTTGPSDSGLVLIGITGSKNAMASAANLALLAGGAILFDRAQSARWRLAAIPGVILGTFLIATTHAATTVMLSALTVAGAAFFWAIRYIPREWRLPLLALSALLLAPAAVYRHELTDLAQDYVFKTFHKDRTLTGRTYLWDVAKEQIAERPVAGWGYKSLWMSYSPAAIGMLRSQQVTDARTFSMHQSYLEAWVDTGIIGLMLFAATIGTGTLAATMRALYRPSVPLAFLALYLANLLIRSTAETLTGPFYVYYTLLLALVAYAVHGNLRAENEQS